MHNPTSELLEFLNILQMNLSKIPTNNKLRIEEVNYICGVDVSYYGVDSTSAAVIYDIAEKKIIEKSLHKGITPFPYIPGLLFMRETPLILPAIKKLSIKPDLILVDGHGAAHPNRAGLAVFVGMMLDIPSMGYAKNLLIGKVEDEQKDISPIIINRSIVGFRIKKNNRLFYISPGFGVDINSIQDVLKLIGEDYPLALMVADKASREYIQ